MNRNRAGLVALLSSVLVTLATQPAFAQSTSSSTTEELIWGLNFDLLAVAIPITILVEAILFYTVWRFRSSNVESAKPTRENRRLEITWTVATAIILLFVGVGAYTVLAQEAVSANATTEAEMNVQVTGQQFYWTFHYPEQNVTVTSTSGELVLPVNKSVLINVSSRDVIHAFHVPGLGLKTDAFPGKSNYIKTTPTETGTYQLYCAEYCGSGHSQMLGTVNVTSQKKFEAWVASKKEPTGMSGTNETATNATG